MLKIDLNIGDIILAGKFKNKKMVVKEFGTDKNGQPTVNGRVMFTFRIQKYMPTKTESKMKLKELETLIENTMQKLLTEDKKYPELDEIINDLGSEVAAMINKRVAKIKSKMPYKGQYVLEELIKNLQERV